MRSRYDLTSAPHVRAPERKAAWMLSTVASSNAKVLASAELGIAARKNACRPHQPATMRLSSPLSMSAARSLAPPTSVPLTNTIGKVGQPVHIFSALRSRQVLK
jgi:hypothetical protein